MKKFFPFSVIALLFCFTANAQYFVLHTKGSITQKDTQAPIKTGDKLEESVELIFGTKESMAIVMSRTQGRMVLSSEKVEKNSDGEFISLLANALVPMKSNMKMSTRGGEAESIVNFKDYFGEESFAIIGEELPIIVNENKYPIDESRIFIARYKFNDKPFVKVIPNEENTLNFKKGIIFDESNPAEVDKVEIYYYDKVTKDNSKVAAFKPIYIDKDELKEEVMVLVDFLKNSGLEDAKVKSEVSSFIYDLYGRVDDVQLEKWIEENNII